MSGAYRDTGAAIERAEALEREVEELRAEVARLKAFTNDRRPDVTALENEVLNLRVENELLRNAQPREETPRERVTNAIVAERDELRREVARLEMEIVDLRARLRAQPEPESDNRDAVIKRLNEERSELAGALREARDRYEAARRDPRRLQELLAILDRLVD